MSADVASMVLLRVVPCITLHTSPTCSLCSWHLQVMLYDDGQGDCITPEHVFDLLEEDLEVGGGSCKQLRGEGGLMRGLGKCTERSRCNSTTAERAEAAGRRPQT